MELAKKILLDATLWILLCAVAGCALLTSAAALLFGLGCALAVAGVAFLLMAGALLMGARNA